MGIQIRDGGGLLAEGNPQLRLEGQSYRTQRKSVLDKKTGYIKEEAGSLEATLQGSLKEC